MMLNTKSRLAKLEKAFRIKNDGPRLFLVQQDHRIDLMEIPTLNFSGSIDDGRRLLNEYPNRTVIIDDIPKWVD